MFLQKLLTNYQLIKTLPLGNVLTTTKIDYYGPFLFDQHAKSYDLASPLFNKPFGAFFPPTHICDSIGKDSYHLQQELNQIISQYLKANIQISFLDLPPTCKHHPFDLLLDRFQTNQFEGEVFSTPFGDFFQISQLEKIDPPSDSIKLNRIKNELRFVCDESYQHILKAYHSFIFRFKTEVLTIANFITLENNVFTTNASFHQSLLQAGITTELVQTHLHWKFPMCLSCDDENTIIKIFKSVYKINEDICLS